jgi:hypothetical protein
MFGIISSGQESFDTFPLHQLVLSSRQRARFCIYPLMKFGLSLYLISLAGLFTALRIFFIKRRLALAPSSL